MWVATQRRCVHHSGNPQAVAQRIEKIEAEVKEIRKVFYCELCNKQYKLAAEMEVHLSSYDHNHKKVRLWSWLWSWLCFWL